MSLKDYLKETLDLGRDDVFKVDVKEGFSLTQILSTQIK
jgi:ATP-dependent RNA helicase DeaD